MKAKLSLVFATLVGALMLGTTSCYWSVDGQGFWDWPVWVGNWAPEVVDADAGCIWDGYLNDNVWYFEAEVDDYDGLEDIVTVEAHVYDDWRGGRWVDGFELLPTSDPWVFYTEYPEHETLLDCYYPGYSVDFYVWDYYDEVGTLTVYPHTY